MSTSTMQALRVCDWGPMQSQPLGGVTLPLDDFDPLCISKDRCDPWGEPALLLRSSAEPTGVPPDEISSLPEHPGPLLLSPALPEELVPCWPRVSAVDEVPGLGPH
eukprot:CAMPEP_0204508836 /NCGR_PEP_ID=MMETSP0471-20130131/110465_1 /ASSEMBLY_ACC=CAM_ASM_000602 /TAXON_ID=2969 /ORGANISM="Oxyrrhis marina" /LENGTH=105 /DNA_ID=CAMNT_0051513869 /DNA_START=423 /DNA_END=737 /DNA_ORIENTATION=+